MSRPSVSSWDCRGSTATSQCRTTSERCAMSSCRGSARVPAFPSLSSTTGKQRSWPRIPALGRHQTSWCHPRVRLVAAIGCASAASLTGSPLDALHDLQRRRLGTAGEEWVVNLEREQLSRSGRQDLADLVRWVARSDGDGLGYDIASFRPTGAPRLIEVTTTNYSPHAVPYHAMGGRRFASSARVLLPVPGTWLRTRPAYLRA